MKLLNLIIIGSISYYAYTQYTKTQPPMIIDEKDLPDVRKLDHNKNYNLLYDPVTDSNIKIVHHFKSQVMPKSNYAVM